MSFRRPWALLILIAAFAQFAICAALIALLALAAPRSAMAEDLCDEKLLLENPYVEGVNRCISRIKRSLATSGKRGEFALKLVERALSTREHGNRAPGMPLDYSELAELAALVDEDRSIDAFLDFIGRNPGSADETRSLAIARLYELRAPRVLGRLATRPPEEQQTVVRSIAWGAANNFYPFLDSTNYRRLAVGPHWEVVEEDHPQRAISKRIEEELAEIVARSKR